MSAQPQILVVDDRANMVRLIRKVLHEDAHVLTAAGGFEAVRILAEHPVAVVVCDLRMPDMDGLDVLRECKRLRPEAEFILVTAHATVPTAIEALRRGAYDYITKPFDPEALRAVVVRALGRAATALPPPSPEGTGSEEVLPGMIARSACMRELASLVRRIAASDATVLIRGETGSGKERVARALHVLSPRAAQRFVALNCAAIPAELLESELFGYARGAFSGAARDRAGLFEEADGGTLFLDEIGDLRPSLQAKLTRAIEERAVRRLGEPRERKVDVRLLAATHRDLAEMVRDKTFREDLFYRLDVATVQVPSLRERRDDIGLLAAHFLRERVVGASAPRVTGLTDAALETLRGHDWPGNVRQLRSAVERASIVATGARIDVGDLPAEVARGAELDRSLAAMTWQDAVEDAREQGGRKYLVAVLERHRGNVADAAAQAGIERESFYRLLRRYGVRPEDWRKKEP